jgi:outer membrane protein OmpA-like peptidoglycan-associated protein
VLQSFIQRLSKTDDISKRGKHMRGIGHSLVGLILALTALTASPALADGKDCPLIGTLDNFSARDVPLWTNYVAYDVSVTQGNRDVNVTKIGKLCRQIYDLKPGIPHLGALEIMTNYEQAMASAGATITNTKRGDTDDIYATVTKDGAEYWLYATESNGSTVTIKVLQIVPFQRTIMPPDASDYPLLGHLPRTSPHTPTKTNFDEFAFNVQNGTQKQQVKVRGFRWHNFYEYPRSPLISGLESQSNYRAVLKDLGAQILYEDNSSDPGEVDARLDNNGKTVWIQVTSVGAGTNVDVIEEKPFQLSIKPPEVNELKAALDKDGHVALYINFDFNKATLKAVAQPVIAQVLALLKANPTLKLSIQGHTDSIGAHDYNVTLSQARAAAVVATLKAQGIAPARLTSAGFGPDKPIAPNDTDVGRAKNRRVELVKS